MNRLLSNKKMQVVMRVVFLLTACFSIIAVLLISGFLLVNGLPAIQEIGWGKFLLGTSWAPNNTPANFGILPMILGSIYVTGLAVLLAAPLGVACASYMVFDSPKRFKKILQTAVELLAGIPSVVYGFFGMVVIVPFVRTIGGKGSSILAASILLALMILPTIISMSKNTLENVTKDYYENAIALGATHERSIYALMLPAARSGILASIVLGIGRAIGETMAVIMVVGNQAVLRLPFDILLGVRTLTGNIVLEMGYASGLHREALIATGLVLFVFIMLLNIAFASLKKEK